MLGRLLQNGGMENGTEDGTGNETDRKMEPTTPPILKNFFYKILKDSFVWSKRPCNDVVADFFLLSYLYKSSINLETIHLF